MKQLLLVILGVLLLCRCRNADIVVKENIKSISVTSRDSSDHRIMEFRNEDSLKLIINFLNNSEAEPLEFYPKYDLNLTYKDGRKVLIYANGDAINIEGHTFTLKRDINTVFGITTF